MTQLKTVLKTVRLYLHVDDYGQELRSEFLYRSCYISNFTSRCVRGLDFKTNGFKGVLVQGRKSPPGEPRVSVETNLIVPMRFDQERYESLGPGEHHEFFLGMLVEGFEKCARYHSIPFEELMAAIEEFRGGGFRNEWTHQKKQLRPFGLQASLLCRVDTERFTLNLMLEQKGAVVFDQQILETKPDEIIFAHRFKEVVVEGEAIVVRDKFGKPLFSLEASSLG